MFRRFFRRALRWGLVGLFVAASIAYYFINNVSHYGPRWHLDPATIERTGTPNDFLAAPPGATAAPIDTEVEIYAEPPRELLARFDEIARSQPRVEALFGSLDELMVTYMQRSRYVGFPDYITVKAIPVGEGASLIVYSRSRYGRSDLGVNGQRVTKWLGAIGHGT